MGDSRQGGEGGESVKGGQSVVVQVELLELRQSPKDDLRQARELVLAQAESLELLEPSDVEL